jgi:hypothetical protein
MGLGAGAASAAGPPVVGEVWSSAVFSISAHVNAEIDPNGLETTYHFEYLTEAAYQANVGAGKDGFSGASRAPVIDAVLAAGGGGEKQKTLEPLVAGTTYRYRVVAKNAAGETVAPAVIPLSLTTRVGGEPILPDSRGWEMVSPVDKNGGQVDPAGAIAGGGVLQAAAAGDAVTYGSRASFGPGAAGAPPASQYVSSRGAAGWATQNLTAPLISGSYGSQDQGVPYRLFSPDLSRGLLLNGDHCRGEATGCAVANPPLAGTGAPAGFQNYYLRDSASGGFTALLGAADVSLFDLDPALFDVSLAGASPDLRHVVLSTCAALTPGATEVPLGEGCDPAKPNLYEWSAGSGLSLINLAPGESQSEPGAALGAQVGAVSADGARVYWENLAGGNLYLREGGQTRLVDVGTFQTASPDGSKALYLKVGVNGGHLYSYDAIAQASTDLTPAGGVLGVLGASADVSRVYYLTAAGLFLVDGATSVEVAATADLGTYPPSTGAARVSADGARLLFVSTASLTGYDNTDLYSGEPDSEVYLYDAVGKELTCVSCNPTNQRPAGPSSIPGAVANGQGPGATVAYKPRVLSADGRRVFFDSRDSLVATDSRDPEKGGDPDVYQWEAQGEGSCGRAGGCVGLISNGRGNGASFVDASLDGDDAFFLTDDSLVGTDPGSGDLYDARIDGGFAESPAPTACEGDSCQPLPPEPIDPTVTTLLPGLGNPPVRYQKLNRHRHGGKHRGHRHGNGKHRGRDRGKGPGRGSGR